jgi:hypothetical protein
MGISAPKSIGFLSGLSAAFSTGAIHKLERGAVVQGVAALHVALGHGRAMPSVSTQIATLRRLLSGEGDGDLGQYFEDVTQVGGYSTYCHALMPSHDFSRASCVWSFTSSLPISWLR